MQKDLLLIMSQSREVEELTKEIYESSITKTGKKVLNNFYKHFV